MKRVAVAVSGGMDSLYAMLSLKRQGHEVLALHGRFLPLSGQRTDDVERRSVHSAGTISGVPVNEGEEALAALCRSLEIPLHFTDLRAQFDHLVITPFVEAWGRGETPNPCALCNPRIKFGLLQDCAFSLGAEALATGHYARLVDYPCDGLELPDVSGREAESGVDVRALMTRRVLAAGVDQSKDQSYFLSLVPKERLAGALFPLGGELKSEIRAWLSAEGYSAPVTGESQEICFIADDDYKAFLRERLGGQKILEEALGGPGPIVQASSGRVLGRHQGLWQYTQGQRRGLGVAFSEPLYVTGKDLAGNRLLVDGKSGQRSAGVRTLPANVLVELEHFNKLLQAGPLWVKTRYRQKAIPAKARQLADGGLHIEFSGLPERIGHPEHVKQVEYVGQAEQVAAQSYEAAAPGQVAVLYAALPGEEGRTEGFYVVAAGVISEAL